MTDADGTLREVTIDAEDSVDGEPIDIGGSEERDVFEAPDGLAVPVRLNGFGGDDALSFGFGTFADGGDGTDVLDLTITQAALEAGTLEAGIVTFDDPADAIAVDVEDGAEGFLHEVRITSSETLSEGVTSETETLFYVLGTSDTLSIDQDASVAAGRVIFEDGAQVLVQLDLGTETTTTGVDETGAPTQDVTGLINREPTIVTSRDIATTQTFDL